MKRTLLISLIFSLICVILPLLVGLCFPYQAPETEPETITETDLSVVYGGDSPSGSVKDDAITVRVDCGSYTQTMTLRNYLIGVVAAEMPVSFSEEALKAQAVAARTYTAYHMLSGSVHPGADVCTDSGCCEAFADASECREKWGSAYEADLAKILSAVEATDGQILLYHAEPILAAFHASSVGRTEDALSVWGGGKPYLVSVPSPEADEGDEPLLSTVTVSTAEFTTVFSKAYPEANFSAEPEAWISAPVFDGAGRVETISVGGIPVSGTEMRSLFSLKSAAFTVSMGEDGFCFSVLGSGHGVGMSQCGANTLAEQGYSYEEILAWYYPDTELGYFPAAQ